MRIVMFICYVFVAFTLVSLLFGKVIKEMKTNYLKADTSIVITNGKPDTIITKKTLPWYLK